MVKVYLIKIKDSNHELAIAIKTNFEAWIKPRQISELFKISKQRINYIIHHSKKEKRKRRTKLTGNEKLILVKWARDKPINLASAKFLQKRFNFLPKSKNENKAQKKFLFLLFVKRWISSSPNQKNPKGILFKFSK